MCVCVSQCRTWSLSFSTSSSWMVMVSMRLRYISQSFCSVELFSSRSSFSSRYCSLQQCIEATLAAWKKGGSGRSITVSENGAMAPPCLVVPLPAGRPRVGCRGGWPGAACPPAPPVCRAPRCRGWLCQTQAGGRAGLRQKDEPKKTSRRMSVNAWNVSDWPQTGLVTTHAITPTLLSNLLIVLLHSQVATPTHTHTSV